MPTAYDYRASAREILGGNIFRPAWLLALVVCLLSTLPSANISADSDSPLSIAIAISMAAAGFIVSGPIEFGISSYFLKLTRDESISLRNAFDGFAQDFGGNFLLYLMQRLFIFLWSLLFVIPGVIKAYAYSMAFYIKNDHPEYGWKKCLDESRRIMHGNMMRLFCLQISFIGWYLVGALCLGVGTLFVVPYEKAAVTEFYNDIKDN